MFSGEKLRFYRQRAGKTQEELAREIGITSAYFSNLENDKRVPSPAVMEKAARALSIRVEDLWTDDGTTPPVPLTAAEKGIVVENGEGADKIRYILPPTPETYALVKQHIFEWKKVLDPRLQEFIDLWLSSSEEGREQILALLREHRDLFR